MYLLFIQYCIRELFNSCHQICQQLEVLFNDQRALFIWSSNSFVCYISVGLLSLSLEYVVCVIFLFVFDILEFALVDYSRYGSQRLLFTVYQHTTRWKKLCLSDLCDEKFLKGKQIQGVIIGVKGKLTNDKSSSFVMLLDAWEISNSKIITWINSFVVQYIDTRLTKYNTTWKVWEHFKRRYTQSNFVEQYQCQTLISTHFNRSSRASKIFIMLYLICGIVGPHKV